MLPAKDFETIRSVYLKDNLTAFFSDSYTNSTITTLVNEFSSNGPILLNNINDLSPSLFESCLPRPQQIVLYTEETAISTFCSQLREHYFWDANCNILVVTFNDAKDWLNELWVQTRAVNVVVMLVTNKIQYFTWFPYKENECDQVISVIELTINGLFPQKIQKNFNKCVLNIVSSQIFPHVLPFEESEFENIEGFEAKAIKEFVWKYNLTGNIFTAPEGSFFWETTRNGRPEGGLKMIYENKADVTFGGLQRRWEYFRFSELGISHNEDYLSWFVPVPDIIPNISKLPLAFPVTYWIYVLISLSALTVTFVFAGELSLSNRVLNSFRVFLFSPVIMPENFLMRVLMMLAYAYSLHITTAFQSSLMFMLSHQILEPEITDIDEALEQRLGFYFYEYHRPLLASKESTLWKTVSKYGLAHFASSPDYQLFIYTKTGVVLGPKAPTPHYVKAGGFVDVHGRIMLTALHTPFSSVPNVMLMSPGHPLKPLLDATNQQLMEGGFIERWFLQFDEVLGVIESTKNVPLTMDALIGAFCLFGLVLVASVVVFWCEVGWKRAASIIWRPRGGLRKKRPLGWYT